jgi:hypothetical protein
LKFNSEIQSVVNKKLDTKMIENTENGATEVLGGENVEATAAAENLTPGKVAKKRANAADKVETGEKREYTPRGTTYWCRRVILLNGEPVGRGRPAKDGKGERKVVYVPVDMEYDVKVHGEGVRYNTNTHKATHKRIAKDAVSYVFDDGIQPTVKADKAKVGKKNADKSTKTDKKVKTGVKKVKKVKVMDVNPVTEVETDKVEIASTETVAV